MERLTYRTQLGSLMQKEQVSTREMIDRLGTYEDAEEQGLLLKLPCKVGTKIYRLINGGIHRGWYYFPTVFQLYEIDLFEKGLMVLTKEEAEQKLAEMKGGHNDSTN